MPYILSFVLFFFAFDLCGQSRLEKYRQLDFYSLGLSEGLSQGNVLDILEDSKGFIWIATESGLNRYDGYQFIKFFSDSNDSSSISSSKILDLEEDDKGNIWIATINGLNVYDWKTGEFSSFFSDKKPHSISDNNIRSLYFDSKNRLWIGTNSGGLNLFNSESKTFTKFTHQKDSNSISDKRINFITEDKKGNLWLGTNAGLYQFNPETKSFKGYKNDGNDPQSLSDNIVTYVYEDSFENMWVCTFNGGLNYFDREKEQFLRFYPDAENSASISNKAVYAILEVEKGIFLVTSNMGLNIFEITGSVDQNIEFVHHFQNHKVKNGLRSNILYRMYKNRYDLVWIGTRYQGIQYFNLAGNFFRLYEGNESNGLNHNNVSDFAEDSKGNIWIGVDGGGINYFDVSRNTFTYYTAQNSNLSSNKVLSVEIDEKDNLWVGTWNGGLNYFNTKTKQFKHYRNVKGDSTSLPGNQVYRILKDDRNNIWISVWLKGLSFYDKDNDQFIRYPYGKIGSESLLGRTIMDICQTSGDKLWLGTEDNGLSIFDPEKKSFINLQNDSSALHSLSYPLIYCIYEDSKGYTWVGTDGDGLKMLNPNTQEIRHFKIGDGLPNNTIYGILEDDWNELWISTNLGISHLKYDYETGNAVFKNYDIDDGLQSNQFNRWAFLKAKNGALFFGGVNGFNVIQPELSVENRIIPPVYITGLQLFNSSVYPGEEDSPLLQSMIETKSLKLTRDQSVFSFEFVALNYFQPQNNQYAYMMEGFDQNWNYINNKRAATYTNLNPGKYTFRVKASNNDGYWNEEGASVEIEILPYWYETIWAKLLFFAITALALVFWYKNRVRQLKYRQQVLERKVSERTKDLREAHAELKEKHEEVQHQSEELQAQNEELNSQREELNSQYEKLEETYEKLKATQAQLIQSEKMASLGFFTAGIAHEINNPVNFIQAGIVGMEKAMEKLLSLMKNYDSIGDDNYREKLKEIEEIKSAIKFNHLMELIEKVTKDIGIGVKRTADIVKELKSFARMESDNLREVDIHQGINSTLFLLQNIYKERITITKEFGNLPLIQCYPSKLNQVFMNILVNAIQAIPEKGTIKIITLHENGGVFIIITDTGKGMPTDVQRQIFEPFFSTKDEGQGTGMGLAITLGIIEEHQGSISVESAVGMGTTMTIKIPIHQS